MTNASALTITTDIWTSDNHNWSLFATDATIDERPVFILRNLKNGHEMTVWLHFGYDLQGTGTQLSIGTLPGYVSSAIVAAIKSWDARADLLEWFPAGSTMTTLLRHVSSSGMSRSISIVHNDQDITWTVARFLGEPLDSHGGIRVDGCGMDMGFHLVYSLSRKLYRNALDTDAGYAISQRWL